MKQLGMSSAFRSCSCPKRLRGSGSKKQLAWPLFENEGDCMMLFQPRPLGASL